MKDNDMLLNSNKNFLRLEESFTTKKKRKKDDSIFVSIPHILMNFDKNLLMVKRSKVTREEYFCYRKCYERVKDVDVVRVSEERRKKMMIKNYNSHDNNSLVYYNN